MFNINKGGHLFLTEAVRETGSQNLLIEAVNVKVTVSVSTPIFIGGYLIRARLG